MRLPMLSIPLVFFFALGGAHAEECVPTTSVTDENAIVVDIIVNGSWPVYNYWVLDRCMLPDVRLEGDVGVEPQHCLLSIYGYSEVNGMAGLQRGDELHDDTCGGLIESDTLW